MSVVELEAVFIERLRLSLDVADCENEIESDSTALTENEDVGKVAVRDTLLEVNVALLEAMLTVRVGKDSDDETDSVAE